LGASVRLGIGLDGFRCLRIEIGRVMLGAQEGRRREPA
jgi:hypothetical protein